jgi:hypothetical protein
MPYEADTTHPNLVVRTDADGIAKLTLNAPRSINALSEAMLLAELEHAVAKDKLTGKALTDFFLEEMLADPMIRLVMQADGVAEADLRDLYAPQLDSRQAAQDDPSKKDELSQGMTSSVSGPRSGRARPGIGE